MKLRRNTTHPIGPLPAESGEPTVATNSKEDCSPNPAGAETSGVRPGRYAWAVVLLLWMVCFFSYADRQAFYSVFPLLRRQMGLTTVQLGMLGSSFAVLYGLTGPFAGYVVDHIRRKTAILGGLEVWSVICIFSGLARNFAQLLFFRASEGIGEAIYYPAALSMVSDYHGYRTRSRAMGFLQTSVYAGTIGGGFLSGAIAQHYGWRASLLVFGGLGCILGLALVRILREPKRGSADLSSSREAGTFSSRHAMSMRDVGSLMRIPTLLALMGVFACANFVALVLLTWIPTYLYYKFHLSLAMAAFDAAVYPQVASIGGCIAGGYLADRFVVLNPRSRLWVQCGGVLAGAPFVALCGLSQSLGAVILALSCWGFCKGIYDSNIFAAAFDAVPVRARGTASGLMNCIGWLIGGGSAPVAIGWLARYFSLGKAIAASASIYVLAALLLIYAAIKLLHLDLHRVAAES